MFLYLLNQQIQIMVPGKYFSKKKKVKEVARLFVIVISQLF
jgi:hypothetical protein